MKEWIKTNFRLMKQAYSIFGENHPIKFASAIAYFSLFALPCIFLITKFILGLFASGGIIYVELRGQLVSVLGRDGADILLTITRNFEEKASESAVMTILYTVVVIWLSTQFFRLFQNALNDLWEIKPDFKSFWKKILMERTLSFVLVLSTGAVFFSSWLVERSLGLITRGILDIRVMDDPITIWLARIITGLLVFLWFALLYKVLPFVRIRWKPILIGAAFTTVLFFAGVALLWQGVVKRDLEEFYSQASPIILVALWMFYSGLIFLFGASFTKVYAMEIDKHIKPAEYAYKLKMVKDEEFHENMTQ